MNISHLTHLGLRLDFLADFGDDNVDIRVALLHRAQSSDHHFASYASIFSIFGIFMQIVKIEIF